jgi:hypothetical protein
MVYQIAINMNRNNFTISESTLKDMISFIYAIVWVLAVIEAIIVAACLGIWILSVTVSFVLIESATELLLWTICVFVWTLIPCLVYGIIEQDLEISDNCVYKDNPNSNGIYRDTKRIKNQNKIRGGYYYVSR